MNQVTIISALMKALFSETRVVAYGDGFLVHLPLSYSDGDSVTIAVFPAGSAYRITDRADALDRLAEAGLNLDASSRVSGLVAALRRDARLSGFNSDPWELADLVDEDHLADSVLTIGRLAQTVEHLRWTAAERSPEKYREVLIRDVSAIGSRRQWEVQTSAPIRLRSGGTRRLTAQVTTRSKTGYVQAVAAADPSSAIEHAYFLFSQFDAAVDDKFAVFDMRRREWAESDLDAVRDVGRIVRYRSDRDLEEALGSLEQGPRVFA